MRNRLPVRGHAVDRVQWNLCFSRQAQHRVSKGVAEHPIQPNLLLEHGLAWQLTRRQAMNRGLKRLGMRSLLVRKQLERACLARS